MTHTLHHGDALTVLQRLPENLVHCIITSPPYFGLRSYGNDAAELGREETPEAYTERLVAVFREARRVLREDGTLWLNLGDSYDAKKSLLLIPQLVAMALRADGWYLRSQIPWLKPNAMPQSVTDRPPLANEYLFQLTKARHYYYDLDAVLLPSRSAGITRSFGNKAKLMDEQNTYSRTIGGGQAITVQATRYRRTSDWYEESMGVVTDGEEEILAFRVSTEGHGFGHFAVMPTGLVRPCVLVSTAEQVCPHCGAPWRRQVERREVSRPEQSGRTYHLHARGKHGATSVFNTDAVTGRVTVGWAPGCACDGNDGQGRSVLLDPFAGSCTVGVVAAQTARDFIGIDLFEEYLAIGEFRISEATLPMEALWSAA